MNCPKCDFEQPDGRDECQRCSIVFSKFHPRDGATVTSQAAPRRRPPQAPVQVPPVKFKFKNLDENGKETGFLSKSGIFTGESLQIDGKSIPAEVIVQTQRRFNRLLLSLLQGDGQIAPVALAITSGNIRALVASINIVSSSRWAELRHQALEEAGRGSEFRCEPCPHCKSTIDLSGLPTTPQTYCRFCDSLVTRQGRAPEGEQRYSICDLCGYFAQPKEFTTFYFYFLLVVYGFSYKQTHRCNSCMRGEAWKMFFFNLPFILGFPVAVVQLLRAYFGGSMLSAEFAGLDKANSASKKGRFDEALRLYDEIGQRLSSCAGVHYNAGLTLLAANRSEEAAARFERALEDCSSFRPAQDFLQPADGERIAS